jgi:OOP family OmpA-OmpF porin
LGDDLKSDPQDKHANQVAAPSESLVYGALRLEARLLPSKDVKFIITRPIQFETNSAVIRTQSYQDLDGIVSVMKENPGIHLMSVEDHTDNAGRRDRNLWLSSARANAVKNYLISKGVSARRLVTRGFGPDLPISTNAHSLGRAKNRRVEFLLISVDGLENP